MPARVRLAVLMLAITVLPVVLWVWAPVSADGLHDRVAGYGAWAPVVWVLGSALLGAALLPGPVLAGAGGLLFGAWLGTTTAVVGAVLSALLSREVGQRAGGAGAAEVLGSRADAVARHGFEVVLAQRLAPGIPDAPLSYAFGAVGVARRAVALGTAVGTLPRAFSYSALGATLDDPGSPLAWAGWAGVVVSAAVGVVAVHRLRRTS